MQYIETIENEHYVTTWVKPRTVFEPYSDPKNSPLVLQKVKKNPKVSQNQKSEFKET